VLTAIITEKALALKKKLRRTTLQNRLQSTNHMFGQKEKNKVGDRNACHCAHGRDFSIFYLK